MLENINTSPNSRDDGAGTPENYLSRAVAACEAGDARLGLHLYLAAFEPSVSGGDEGTLGIMLSMNRVGLVWSGDHRGLVTNVVRGE